jgi:hypothetical protein
MTSPASFESFLSRIESQALRAVAQHWHEVRGKNLMPSWADLTSPAFSPYFKMLWGFQYDREAKQFRGWLAGHKLRKWVDDDFCGGQLKDHAPLPSYQQIHEQLTRIVTIPQAVRSSGQLFIVDDLAVTGERIALPLAADGTNADGVFGASDYVSPPLLGRVELVYENMEWYTI